MSHLTRHSHRSYHIIQDTQTNIDRFDYLLYIVLYNEQLNIKCTLHKSIMKSKAPSTLPRKARLALLKLGEDISVARKKRRISTVSMAERAFISRGTLYKVEKGDPTVSMGIYATVLAILGLVEGLGQVANRRDDTLGLDIDEDHLPKKIGSPRRKKPLS